MTAGQTSRLNGRALLRPSVLIAAALVLAAAVVFSPTRDEEPMTVSADFVDTTGLYVGNEVQYLGVPVGEVTEIEPAGTTMTVHMELDSGTELPAESGATIMQSSLVTDRYVELGPAYTGGPTLASGSHLEASHTRSPANMDQVVSSIDDLVVAMDSTTPGGKDVGDLLDVTARTLKGNGGRLRRTMTNGEAALRTINDNGGDIKEVTANLATLVDALAARDDTIRSFSTSMARTTGVVAQQRKSITSTLRALHTLTGVVDEFIATNRDVIGKDLDGALEISRSIRKRQSALAETFDTMPTLAENMTRAYDQRTGRLRVQFSTRTGPFSAVFRNQICEQLNVMMCDVLVNEKGDGLLDPLFDSLANTLPGDFP